MDYAQARRYVAGTLKFGMKMGLERMQALMAELGNPQDHLKFIHIAGTNGKGSTSMYAACSLASAGFRVGLFTSPFIERFTERVRVIDGRAGMARFAMDEEEGEIGQEDFARLITRIAAAVEHLMREGMESPTEFELITAAALLHFDASACDYAVLEVGLGGIYDSTNIIPRAEACVITAMGYDHMDRLGDTMAEITANKAGIIKPGCRTLLYDPAVACDIPEDAAAVERVVRNRCEETGSSLYILRANQVQTLAYGLEGQDFTLQTDDALLRLHTGLLGRHQPLNASLAALAVLPLAGPEAVVEGIAAARWPVRQEIVRQADPPVVIDGSHNPQSVRELADTLGRVFKGRNLVFVCGVMADKDHAEMLRLVLASKDFLAAAFIAVTPDNPRAMGAEALLQEARTILMEDRLVKTGSADYNETCMLRAIEDPVTAAGAAMQIARANNGVVCVFGSLYMVGAVRSALRRGEIPEKGDA